MTITLPDELRDRVSALAKARGFATPEACLLDMVLQNLADDANPNESYSDAVVSRLTPKNRDELEAMLDEGMNSEGCVNGDSAFWAERRRVLLEKMSRKTGTTS